jgi:hypothetical protein
MANAIAHQRTIFENQNPVAPNLFLKLYLKKFKFYLATQSLYSRNRSGSNALRNWKLHWSIETRKGRDNFRWLRSKKDGWDVDKPHEWNVKVKRAGMRRVLGGRWAGPWRRGGGRASRPGEHAAAARSTIPHSTGNRIQDVLDSKNMFSHPWQPQAGTSFRQKN